MKTLLVSTEFKKRDSSVLILIRIHLDGYLIKEIYYEFFGKVLPQELRINDFALLAVLPFAMEKGFNLHIIGSVHLDVLQRMEESQDAWVRWHPHLFKKIAVSVDEEKLALLKTGKDAILAYSGGLDATYALHAHVKKMLGRRSCNIVAGILIHGFDIELSNSDIFDDALIRTNNILSHYGVSQSVVRTNWKELGTDWEKTHMFGIASVMHLFSSTFDCGVVASDVAYDEEELGWGSNSVTNPFFSSIYFPLDFTGGSCSRTNKAEALVNEAVVLQNLRVCYSGAVGNCGKCEKCVRTKLNFLAVGLDRIAAFDDDITLGKIKRLYMRDVKSVNRIRRIVKEGTWLRFHEEKKALEHVIKRGPQARSIYSVIDKWKNSIKKRIKFKI